MSSPDPGQYAPRRLARHPRRRRTVRNALWVVAALVVLVIAFVGVYVAAVGATFNDKRQTVEAGIATGAATEDGALNVLLLGSDSRGDGQDTAENKGEDGQRSDTMMLVHIPEDRQGVYVMSIVRDLWVEIPGHGQRKINAALDLGGYPLVTQTVEELTGAQIDHLAIVDFEGFNGLTEALGGVQLCNPNAFSSGVRHPAFYPQGEILLQGSDALRFVRERKAFTGGDFQRVQNQQRFISAVLDRVLTVDTLANPQRLMDVVNSFAPFITVDEGLDAATIAGYLLQMSDLRPGDVEMFTVPHSGPAEGPGGASIVLQDEEAMAALQHAFRTDTVDEFLEGPPAEDQDGTDDGGTAVPDPGATPSASPGDDTSTDGAQPTAPGNVTGDATPPAETPRTTPADVCAGA